jgi:hypothetical protein
LKIIEGYDVQIDSKMNMDNRFNIDLKNKQSIQFGGEDPKMQWGESMVKYTKKMVQFLTQVEENRLK